MASTYKSSDSLLQSEIALKRDLTDNTFSNVIIDNGTSSSTLSQVTNQDTNASVVGIRVSGNLQVNERLYLGNGEVQNGYLSTDAFILYCNGPNNNTAGFLDVQMGRLLITDSENMNNFNLLQYKNATRIDVLKSSDYSTAGTIAYIADTYPIEYSSTTYTTSTFSSNYAGATTDWTAGLIVKIDPTANNDDFTITTSTLDSLKKVRVINVNGSNHTADVIVNGTTYNVAVGYGLTAIKTPVGYWTFSAL